jgi:formamidopyrimidine-DNA glycosylase
MPELPEVETVVRDLRPVLRGRRIERVELGRRQVLKSPPRKIVEALEGATVESIERWGKNIVLRATNGGPLWWLIHLGMSGRLVVQPASEPRRKHTHGIFTLDSGDELRFTDPRMFGAIEVSRTLPKRLGKLGPEPLEITQEQFVASLRRRRARLKALLLDQTFVRGVGNIYADESLFRARLHPKAIGARVPIARAAALHKALQQVLRQAIDGRGSSVRDYVDGRGEAGRFQFEHLVYGRAGSKCKRCRTILRGTIVAGRTTCFCPKCQKR